MIRSHLHCVPFQSNAVWFTIVRSVCTNDQYQLMVQTGRPAFISLLATTPPQREIRLRNRAGKLRCTQESRTVQTASEDGVCFDKSPGALQKTERVQK